MIIINESNKCKAENVSESVSLKDIQDAEYAKSFMDDRAEIHIDGEIFSKIGKNEWQHMPMSGRAIGGTYTDKEIFNKIKDSKKSELLESVINEASYSVKPNRG